MFKKFRDDTEWSDIISTCRASGLSDRNWCLENGIAPSSFYNAIKRLRNRACSIPVPTNVKTSLAQEAVSINLDQLGMGIEPVSVQKPYDTGNTAVRICINKLNIEITNSASSSIIQETIGMLLRSC